MPSGFSGRPVHDAILRETRPSLLVLQATTVFSLLIAVATVAYLFLVQVVGRSGEMAIRTVIGDGWAQVGGRSVWKTRC